MSHTILRSPGYNRMVQQRQSRMQLCNPDWLVNLHTDAEFIRSDDDGFGTDETTRRIAHAQAQAAGISTAGKKYSPQLARGGLKFKDPLAWYGCPEDVRRAVQARGLGVEFSSTLAADVPCPGRTEEPAPYRVADDLVEARVDDLEADHGQFTPSERAKVTEQVREQMSPTVPNEL